MKFWSAHALKPAATLDQPTGPVSTSQLDQRAFRLIITGRSNEAVIQSRIAKDLDPFSPSTALGVCKALYFQRNYDQAITCFDKVVQDHPDYLGARYSRGLMYLQQGKYDEAVAIFEDLYGKDRRLAGAALGYTYGVTRRVVEARRVLAEMLALLQPTNLPPQEIALIYLGLGDVENALVWLKKSVDQHFAPATTLGIDPLFEKLLSDPRFTNLLKRYNLPLSSLSK